jgi:hypothetical protein
MNRYIGMYAALINAISVLVFALSLIVGSDFLSYLSSMAIAFSFIPMVCAFAFFTQEDRKVAGYTAIALSAIYGTLIIVVYFAQLTTVTHGGLSPEAVSLLDYGQFGLYFNYNLLGYGMMALSTFFVGLTIVSDSTIIRWLKYLLIVHGVFFISGLMIPIMGVFQSDMGGSDWIGTLVLLVWCAYFIPIGILSYLFFKQQKHVQVLPEHD